MTAQQLNPKQTGQENSPQCYCMLFAGQALLSLASGGCSLEKHGRAWQLIEILLNSYASRRAEQ